MNVCMICPTFPPNDKPCGVGDYTHELALRLSCLGLSLTVVASTSHRGDPRSSIPTIPFTRAWDRRALSGLLRMIRTECFNLVHIQYTPELYGRSPWMKLFPAASVILGGPPVIVTPHTLVGGYPSATVLAPLLVGFSRRIICPNDEVAYLISRYLPFLRRRVRPIPIGSNIPGPPTAPASTRRATRVDLGLDEGMILLSHFGFAYPGKGLETLLGALAALHAAGTPFRLAVIGSVWPGAEAYAEQLQTLSRNLGLNDHVQWLGRCSRERVAALLSASDIYVVPYDDGISSRRGTLMAGVVHGLPIISTYPARPSRWFRDGENVLLVPPKDEAALTEAILEMIASPDLRQRLRQGIQELACTFSWPRIAEATAAVYREVCP